MPDMIVASTTATDEEIKHAVSKDWRQALPAEKPTTEVAVEEQETETPATSEEEVETAPASEPEVKQEPAAKGKGGFQKRIDKLTKANGELAAKAARVDEIAEQLESYKERFERLEKRFGTEAEPEKKVAAADSKTPPKPLESEIGTKYKTWEEYNEALIDWKADRRVEARLAERDETSAEREQREVAEERDAGYREAAKVFAEQTPDFNAAINAATKAGMRLPEPIIDLIKELPNGPAVTYYLVTNPDEALALIEMQPQMGFAAIGRISQGLEAESRPAAKPVVPAKKIVSAAPAPVKPVAGSSAKSGNSLEDVSKRDTDEYVRIRMRQIAEKNARRYS